MTVQVSSKAHEVQFNEIVALLNIYLEVETSSLANAHKNTLKAEDTQ